MPNEEKEINWTDNVLDCFVKGIDTLKNIKNIFNLDCCYKHDPNDKDYLDNKKDPNDKDYLDNKKDSNDKDYLDNKKDLLYIKYIINLFYLDNKKDLLDIKYINECNRMLKIYKKELEKKNSFGENIKN